MATIKICAAITNDDIEAVKDVESLVDLFEVRIDLIGDGWEKLVKQIRKPWIATNRTIDEGGKWSGNEARRIEKLLQAIELGAEMVDVEFKTKNLTNIVPFVRKRVKCILSFHDMKKTPSLDELKKIVEAQINAGADICKVVTTANYYEDNLKVLQLVREFPGLKMLAFAMGPLGLLSRVLCPVAGCAFTYASIEKGKESAPGQITVEEMKKVYEIMGQG